MIDGSGVLGARPAPDPAVEWAYTPPDAVVYDPRTETVAHLNGSAGSIWMLIDGTRTVDDVIAELSDVYELPIDRIRPDVEAALADFARRGLLDGPS